MREESTMTRPAKIRCARYHVRASYRSHIHIYVCTSSFRVSYADAKHHVASKKRNEDGRVGRDEESFSGSFNRAQATRLALNSGGP